jgi:hypothetical protein
MALNKSASEYYTTYFSVPIFIYEIKTTKIMLSPEMDKIAT